MNRRKPGAALFFAVLLWLFLFPEAVLASEEAYDYSGAQKIMDETLDKNTPSFSDMVSAVTSGKLGQVFKELPGYLISRLLSEIDVNKKSLGHVLLLAAFGTIFSGMASSFQDKQAGETGFYVTYIVLLSLLLTAFYEASRVAEETVSHVTEFVGALLPAFTLAVASTGKTLTSVFSYEFIIGAVSVTQWMFLKIFLPGIQIYVVLTLVNHISKEEILTKMTELLGMLLSWGVKTVIGVVVGYGAVQSMVLPLADSLKTGAVTKALSVIPGIGTGAGAAASLVTGTAALIKNGIGVTALIVLVLICAIPVLKLAVITILYYSAAAMVQPVADERVTECLAGAASGVRMLLKVTFASAGMFFLLIGVLCAFSSVQI